MKKHIHIYALLLMLLPLLTGCFQQAGEAFQPASSTEGPITVPTNPDNGGGNIVQETPIPVEPNFPDTSATPEIDMTIISPTRSFGPTATIEDVVIPTDDGTQPTAETQTFRTPISPLGQVNPDTPAPVIPSGDATATPSGLITPTALPGIGGEPSSGGECTYTIQRGDTLFRIATHNNTTVSEIAAANPGININLIQPGQVIQLPGCTASGSGEVTAPTTAPDTSGNPPTGSGTTYTVQAGDTLFAIAQRFGVTVQAIVNANNMSNPNNLSLGQELIIPAAS
ncbi:MAG: LysM peptidoglycan-binding domain-containing protein [Chloroflexota bacterium]